MENFISIYNQYEKQVFNYVNQRINYKTEIAEELTQDIFVKISNSLHTYDESKSSLKTWVFTIVNNTIIDHFRTDKSFTVNVDGYTDDNGNDSFQFEGYDTADSEIINSEKQTAINNAFETLTGLNKRVAILSLMEQKSYNEVSAILDIPLGSVKGCLSRAKNQLRKALLENSVIA